MENVSANCPLHGDLMEEKSGQYGPYWSHRTTEGYCNGKKISPFKKPGSGYPAPAPAITREPIKEEKVDWDAIAEGKVRHGVVVAVIENGGLEALKGQLPKIQKVVGYIMTGEIPEE